jgi:O-acetylserine/cysteine efflux transporter
VVLDWLVMKEVLDVRKSIGTLLAIAGVAIVIGLPAEAPAVVPTLMIIASAFCWSLGQVLARKLGRDSGVGLLKANAFGSVPQLLLATLILEQGQWTSIVTATPLQWLMLLFVGVVGFYLAYMCWFTLLKSCRMDEVAPFILLMPVVGIVTAYFLLGEQISVAQLAGGAVLLAGLAVVSGIGIPEKLKAGLVARP